MALGCPILSNGSRKCKPLVLLPDGVDKSRLGGADYPVNTTSGIVRLCMSNRAVGDGLLQTLCFNVGGDNSVEETEKIGTTVATVQRKVRFRKKGQLMCFVT